MFMMCLRILNKRPDNYFLIWEIIPFNIDRCLQSEISSNPNWLLILKLPINLLLTLIIIKTNLKLLSLNLLIILLMS